jgi:flagellar basal body-associated protein FliL
MTKKVKSTKSAMSKPVGGSKKYMYIGIGVVVLIIIIGLVYYFFFSGDDGDTRIDSPEEIAQAEAELAAYESNAEAAQSQADGMSDEIAAMEAKAKEIQASNKDEFEKEQAEANLQMAVANAQAAALEAKNALAEKEEVKDELEISTNERCGNTHNKTRCPGKEMCSRSGWCGLGDEYDYTPNSPYHGPNSKYHNEERPHSGKCGPDNNEEICPKDQTCSSDGLCGVGKDFQHDPYSTYGGPDSIYNRRRRRRR